MASETLFTIHQSPWFLAYRVTLKMLVIGSAECSWGEVKSIKSGNTSALGSEISEKLSIVYTSY